MTSAPRSPSVIAQNGPASARVRSTTRTPSSDRIAHHLMYLESCRNVSTAALSAGASVGRPARREGNPECRRPRLDQYYMRRLAVAGWPPPLHYAARAALDATGGALLLRTCCPLSLI